MAGNETSAAGGKQLDVKRSLLIAYAAQFGLSAQMLSLKTEVEVLRSVADSVRHHRLAQGLRQGDLAEKSGVSIATLRRFERTGHIGFFGLVRLLVTLGLADAFIASFQRVPETPPSIKEFMTANATRRKRAPRRPR